MSEDVILEIRLLAQKFDSFINTYSEHRSDIKTDLEEMKQYQKAQNGRVTKLEHEKTRLYAYASALAVFFTLVGNTLLTKLGFK